MEEKITYPGQLVFGLDIGTRSIVGTVGYKEEDQFYVVAQIMKEHESRAMMDGQIHDISKVSETITYVKKALEQETNRIYRDVCIAAAGRVLQTITINVEEKYRSDHKITQDDLYGLNSLGVEKAYQEFEKENESDVKFYCVGYSVVQYYLNGYPINNLIDHKAKSISVDLIATFLPDDVVSGLYEAVDKANLHVANMTLEPIAAIQVAIPENYRTLNIAMVDIGAGTSDISITKDGSIISYGMIPFAGDAITKEISKYFLCDFETAERMKREASEKEEIPYTDIMGLKQTIKKEEIQTIVEPILKQLAEKIADKIKESNGSKSVSAVFIVGGGGTFVGFCDKLAEQLEILKERVALRSLDTIGNIHFLNENARMDSLFVTPVGICLNFYEQNNNFIYVTFNGDKIKLYDNGKLTVVDATMQAKYPKENLFPKRGPSLHISIDGKPRIIRGKAGEAPMFKVNGKEGDMNTVIHENDKIVIKKPKAGEAASMDINQLPEFQGTIQVKVSNKEILLPKFANVNGKLKSGFYSLEDQDKVEMLSYYTVKQILDFLDLSISKDHLFLVNNVQSDLNTPVYDKFSFEWVKKENYEEKLVESKIIKKENLSDKNEKEIVVMINKEVIKMIGKQKYIFVDVFDYIDFDLTKSKGRGIVTTVNGKVAEYMEEIHDNDDIKIYWNQE